MSAEPMVPVMVCRRWEVQMPESRARRPGWSFWEQERLAYLWAMIRPGDVVWEIGAERADTAVLFALWGADVVLIEPDPDCWPTIRAVFAANGVTDKIAGEVRAAVGDGPPALTLDELLDQERSPDVVAIDIEGDEYRALLGADRLLADARPALAISVHPDFLWDRHKDTPDDVWMHLELHGYETERVGRDHEIHVIAKPR